MESVANVALFPQNHKSYFNKQVGGFDFFSTFATRYQKGELSEWLKEPASKTGVRVTVPGVRIPHSPQFSLKIKQL